MNTKPRSPMGTNSTEALLACGINQAVVACVRDMGAASRRDIAQCLQAQGLVLGQSKLNNLVGAGVLVNTCPGQSVALYGAGHRAWLFVRGHEGGPMPVLVPAAAQQPAAATAPLHAGQRVAAPAYDRMRAPVYRPGPGPAMRPGATDFLQCPSRGHRC